MPLASGGGGSTMGAPRIRLSGRGRPSSTSSRPPMKFSTLSAAALSLALGVSPVLLTAQEKYPDGAPKLDYEGQPIAVKAVRAFPKLKIPRPIVLTNFGD